MDNLFKYTEHFLEKAQADSLFSFCSGLAFTEYPYRGKKLTRSPKAEFRKDGTVGAYRWGQQIESQSWGVTSFPAALQDLYERVGDEKVNHILIIRYTHGTKHHIPYHSDKQEGVDGAGAKDIKAGTNIYNVVVCDQPRLFELAEASKVDKSTNEACETVFSCAVPHGSLLMLTADGNKALKHRVRKDRDWQGCRYSIVMRCIKSQAEQPIGKKRKERE